MSPQSPPATLNDFACRLLPLRERLQHVPAGPSTELAEARSLLESLEAEAEVLGRSALAEIIRRLVLLLEVWECLTFEGSDSAADVAAFCDRALAHLIEMSGEAEAMTDWSWILEESSASWADYLDLLDPSGTLAPHPAAEESHRSPSFLEDDPPSIAPATLLRLLAGDAGEVPSASRPVSFSTVDRNWEGEAPAEPGPSPQPSAGSAGASPSRREGNGPASLSIEIPPPPTHLELDAEMREVFLAEVTDLFERVETLVLGLGREGDPAEALHELGRCFHTLKGAAGSVGLVELSSLIHLLESQLEAAGSTVSPGLLDLLHTSLGYLEGVLAALRQGGTAPRSATVVEAPRRLPEATSGPLARAPKADEARAAPEAPAPASAATPIDGSIRIPSSRIEELMDIASELIGRRGLWTTQAVRMKEFAGMARACRSRLMGCLDRLHAIGLPRDSEEESRPMPESGAELSELVRRLSEQADDLAVLTEFAQAATLPLADNGDSLARPYPIIAVNDADTKHLFDNRYGTGQSTIDGIIRATNFLLAGSKFVVAGYGWCGRGLASRARGAGAEVIVTEIDPTKALEAVMDGFRVMSMEEASKLGDVFCTVTGNKNVLAKQHFELMKDGAIISNSGHFNVEIDIPSLEKLSSSKRTTRDFVEEYTMRDGRRINLLGEGRLINLAAAEGHPASVMDMSFADQALSAEYMVKNYASLEKKVYTVPVDLDKRVAKLKLESLGIKIDRLTSEQEEYLASWSEGT